MARRKRNPFGGSLEIERGGDELLGRNVLPSVDSFEDQALEEAHKGVDRVDQMKPRSKAMIYAAAGGLGCLGLWAMKFFAADALSRLWNFDLFPTVVVAVSCVAAYGLLQLVLGPVVAPQASSGGTAFGGFVQAHGDETRWKRRLLAVVGGLLHAALFAIS